jgi:hypothetical protein
MIVIEPVVFALLSAALGLPALDMAMFGSDLHRPSAAE